jgi:hypothetical protein
MFTPTLFLLLLFTNCQVLQDAEGVLSDGVAIMRRFQLKFYIRDEDNTKNLKEGKICNINKSDLSDLEACLVYENFYNKNWVYIIKIRCS